MVVGGTERRWPCGVIYLIFAKLDFTMKDHYDVYGVKLNIVDLP